MNALDRFAVWLGAFSFVDRNKKLPLELRLQYHSRSDAHSKKLGALIVEDLLDRCADLREQAMRGEVGYGINYRYIWPNGKAKTLDLAVGTFPDPQPPDPGTRIRNALAKPRRNFVRLLIACEEKSVMTEHGKSQPRIYSELNDAHTIVHRGSRDTISAGITMINIATTFVSPLRQRRNEPPHVTVHIDQPHLVARMVEHLRKLPVRDAVDQVGFDAYCTFVVDLDNQGHVALHVGPPAPQPDDSDHYETFLDRIAFLYHVRYRDLANMPETQGLGVEESLVRLADAHPGLLTTTGQLAVDHDLEGAPELRAILESVEHQANPPGRADRE